MTTAVVIVKKKKFRYLPIISWLITSCVPPTFSMFESRAKEEMITHDLGASVGKDENVRVAFHCWLNCGRRF